MILASQSPRRKELLTRITADFSIMPADIDETKLPNETPKEYVMRLGQEKAQAISKKHPEELIIASDTIVALGNKIMGKPHSEQQAKEMLQELSGKTHEVHTSIALKKGSQTHVEVVSCQVTFYPLTKEDLKTYLATKEYQDKAGAYGIQGYGALLVEKINGDYYAVMGLPIARLNQLLKNF